MKVLYSFLVCAFIARFAVCLPSTTAKVDAITTSPDSAVPREFPNFNQNYTFVDNSSIRENLASHSDIDTEVEDLLSKDVKESQEIPSNNEENEDVPKIQDSEPDPLQQDESLGRKGAIEWIENGEDTEDGKFESERNTSTTEKDTPNTEASEATSEKQTTIDVISEQQTTIKVTSEDQTQTTTENVENSTVDILTIGDESNKPYKDGVPLIDGSVAAILVGVFLVVCIVGYTALILWRRSLELKYGSREMLVDQDEMFDPDDMKHFSI